MMIRNLPAPDTSPDFTVEDIHKIREWHYEILKDATPDERRNFYAEGTQIMQHEIEELRRTRAAA